jgi:hypothetical protein
VDCNIIYNADHYHNWYYSGIVSGDEIIHIKCLVDTLRVTRRRGIIVICYIRYLTIVTGKKMMDIEWILNVDIEQLKTEIVTRLQPLNPYKIYTVWKLCVWQPH